MMELFFDRRCRGERRCSFSLLDFYFLSLLSLYETMSSFFSSCLSFFFFLGGGIKLILANERLVEWMYLVAIQYF